jgi:hypothetical protein
MREGRLPEPIERWLEDEAAQVSDIVITDTGRNRLSLDEARRRLLQRKPRRRDG